MRNLLNRCKMDYQFYGFQFNACFYMDNEFRQNVNTNQCSGIFGHLLPIHSLPFFFVRFFGFYSQTFPVFSIALKQIHDATICNVYVAKMHL